MHVLALESDRLILRFFSERDDSFILELLNDPAWVRFIGNRKVHSLADARAYIERGPTAMYAAQGFGLYAVERKEDGVVLGMCGLIRRAGLDDVDLGFALLPRYRGQGYAYEASLATLRFADEVLGLPRVVAITSMANERSQELLVQLGFAQDGEIRLSHTDEPLSLFRRVRPVAADSGSALPRAGRG